MSHDQDNQSPLDQATRKRLARLSTVPVDTTGLERKLAKLMQVQTQPDRTDSSQRRLWRAVSALAAVLAIAAAVTFTLVGGSAPAVASPIELRQLHGDILAGRLDLTAVTTIEQANDEIKSQQRDTPQLPGFEHGWVQSCCLTGIQGKLVAVALLDYQGQPVTLVVARGRDFAHPMGQPITIDSHTFMTHELDGVQMVMAHEGDLWLCVMGDGSAEDLALVAAGIKLDD
jgi:hypothetical protein